MPRPVSVFKKPFARKKMEEAFDPDPSPGGYRSVPHFRRCAQGRLFRQDAQPRSGRRGDLRRSTGGGEAKGVEGVWGVEVP